MSAETRLAAATPSERDVARGVFTSFAPAFTQLFPRSAGVHHPQIGVRRIDHAKRHPEVTPLSPTVAPTVLDKSELFRLVVGTVLRGRPVAVLQISGSASCRCRPPAAT